MLLDVDHFKKFNDTHGHRAGDEALRVLAAALRGAMRQMDLVTRYGGEEFLVILPGTAIDCATQVAERTRQDISQASFRYDGKNLSLTVSIGVAQLAPNEQMGRMLERVDQAMYASKEAGRNRTSWHDGRAVHPAIEMSLPGQPAPQSRTMPSRPEAGAQPRPASALAPAPEETAGPAGRESLDPIGSQCDRTAFLWHVRQRIAEWKRGGAAFCVLLVQVEQDSQLLKTQSQKAREDVLRATTRILNGAVREMDMVCRYGHGCFGFLLPRTALQQGLFVAQRVCQSIDVCEPPFNRSREQFTLRVGVAEVAEGDDVVRLLQRAEAAMSVAENNQIGYHDGQWPEVVEIVAQAQALDLSAAPGAGRGW